MEVDAKKRLDKAIEESRKLREELTRREQLKDAEAGQREGETASEQAEKRDT